MRAEHFIAGVTTCCPPPRAAGSATHAICERGRYGFSMLEVQVALVVFGIALTGLGPLVVMHSRQLRKLEARFSPGATYYAVPTTDLWARKLGAAASIATYDTSGSPAAPITGVNDVQIQSVEKSLESETVTVYVTVQAKSP